METVANYRRSRAWAAICFPLAAIGLLLANLSYLLSEFDHGWDRATIGVVVMATGIVWWLYALWPSAIRLLSGGPSTVKLDNETLFLGNRKIALIDIKAVGVVRPWFQHPRVEVKAAGSRCFIETAYQSFDGKRSVESIAAVVSRYAELSGN